MRRCNNNARHSSSSRQTQDLLYSGSGNQEAQIMSWVGPNKAREKMDELGHGNYRQSRRASRSHQGRQWILHKVKTTKDRHAPHVASQTRERTASHRSIPKEQQSLLAHDRRAR